MNDEKVCCNKEYLHEYCPCRKDERQKVAEEIFRELSKIEIQISNDKYHSLQRKFLNHSQETDLVSITRLEQSELQSDGELTSRPDINNQEVKK